MAVIRAEDRATLLAPADTPTIAPNTRHWHGAASDRIFGHLAMPEVDDQGGGTEGFEAVGETDYTATPAPVA